MLAEKKRCRTYIIEGLHNHYSGNKINKMYPKHKDMPISRGPCNACNDPHLIKDCNESKLW